MRRRLLWLGRFAAIVAALAGLGSLALVVVPTDTVELRSGNPIEAALVLAAALLIFAAARLPMTAARMPS